MVELNLYTIDHSDHVKLHHRDSALCSEGYACVYASAHGMSRHLLRILVSDKTHRDGEH